MLSIYSKISQGCVLINPEVNDKASLIKMMVESLKAAGKIEDTDVLFRDVMKREDLSSTALDCGCAIPHAQSSALKTPAIAAALLTDGLDFNAPDGTMAQLVFLITVPENKAGLHLKLLSKMARILHNDDFREKLMSSDSEERFLELINKQES